MADELAEVLSEFARTMVTDFPIQAILDHVVTRIVEIMPITAAGVTLISPGVHPRYIAASSEDALSFEELQSELNEGPCVAAYQSGKAVLVPDLRHEDRFSRFTALAIEAGLAAVFTFPLYHRDRQLGALNLYRDTPGRLSADSMSSAQTLADVVTSYLVNAQGREDLQDAHNKSHEATLHDPLTGLPNRLLLLERLEHAFVRNRRSGLVSAVFFVDLDCFKGVNDTYGHKIGDELLIAVAVRLGKVLRAGDTLARLSGDEFVILCEDLDVNAAANLITERLGTPFDRPFIFSRVELDISASVGLAFTGHGCDNPEDVLHAADMAMYTAKRARGDPHVPRAGRGRGAPLQRESDLETDIGEVMSRHELHLDYQPIVRTEEGCISSVEALLRWDHPKRGLVPPTVLVPLAERSGLIAEIGLWVLAEASSEQDHWQSRYGVDDVAMSVNVSAHQLMSAGFTEALAAVLSTASASPNLLTLEITESVFVRDGGRGLLVLNDLKDLGVTLALDDFGTGYSSLSYLLQFPIDLVKIDRTFVTGLAHDRASRSIVSAVIGLAHGLGMKVVAEGVETAEQHRELRRLGCDFCQGFYFARPMPAARLETLIRHGPDGSNRSLPMLSAAG